MSGATGGEEGEGTVGKGSVGESVREGSESGEGSGEEGAWGITWEGEDMLGGETEMSIGDWH